MTFERWDIVTALFPFTEIAVRRPRPVLVLSQASFNLDHGHLIGAMITTGARSRWPSDHLIADLSIAGLGSVSRPLENLHPPFLRHRTADRDAGRR